MKKNFSDSEIFLPIVILILSICSFIVLFSAGIFFYSKSVLSENVTTQVKVYVCGDNISEYDEVCDGTDLNGLNCTNLGYDFGTLSCKSDCTAFDISGCVFEENCGNNVKESGELCDGTDLNNQSCTSLGYDGGDLFCASNCLGFVTNACYLIPEPTAVCGNQRKEIGEVCDGTDLNYRSCESLGYDYGTLACSSTCISFITSGCKYRPSEELCGNQAVDEGEICDGRGLNGETCESLGYVDGTLRCNDTCSGFDASECVLDYEICVNDKDDDMNGFQDCYDAICMTTDDCLDVAVELCFNNIDDDHNNFTDCNDAKCSNYEYCLNRLTENCVNNKDDNNDGFVDCEDVACLENQLCYEEGEEIPPEELPETGEEKESLFYLTVVCLTFPILLILILLVLLVLLYRQNEEKKRKDGATIV